LSRKRPKTTNDSAVVFSFNQRGNVCMLQRVNVLLIALAILAFARDSHAQIPSFSFVTIPNGTFTMGCPVTENGCSQSHEAQHSVTISRDFEMMDTEITQYEWFQVMGSNPSGFSDSADCFSTHTTISGVDMCPNLPVEHVSWNAIQTFISIVNAAAGLTCANLPSDPSGCVRLPTEAEWEYAHRAGTTLKWIWGTTTPPATNHAWYSVNSGTPANPGGQTHDGGGKLANGFGLYDTNGNVWEWVNDYFVAGATPAGGTDPTGAATGSFRAFRGGAYNHSSNCLDSRSARRMNGSPTQDFLQVGFRLARNL
jgi:formylglycine-generating enzyme required for sulfatase activity